MSAPTIELLLLLSTWREFSLIKLELALMCRELIATYKLSGAYEVALLWLLDRAEAGGPLA